MAQHTFLIILVYSLWLASAALSLWAVLWLRIFVLIDLPMATVGGNPWIIRAIDRFGTVVIGLVWLVFVVATEAYFRRLLKGGLPILSITKIFAAEALILAIAYGGHLWLN
ncbi:MAG: hypothetical protein JXM69_03795 [Anaerolineae bacterium]|nr:hypothetical protein [Anaerolineae bacterium]